MNAVGPTPALMAEAAPISPVMTSPDPRQFIEDAFLAYQSARATANHPVQSLRLELAGRSVTLEFASSDLFLAFAPALAGLPPALPEAVVELEVYLWDSRSTNSSMISPTWTLDDHLARAEIRNFHTPSLRGAYQLGVNALSLIDLEENRALYWLENAAEVPYYERAAPLRIILSWWLGHWNDLLVHAAAVGTSQGAALITGKSGTGKSTTALACLAHGLGYLADDYAIVRAGSPPRVQRLYSLAKKNRADLDRLPDMVETLQQDSNPGAEKVLYDLAAKYRDQLLHEAPLRAILVPSIQDQEATTLEPMPSSLALRALAPSTILQLPHEGQGGLQRMAALVRQVPCYQINLGRDLGQVAARIGELLQELNS